MEAIPISPRPKLYVKLRARMVEAGLEGFQLCKLVGLSESAFSRKMCGHVAWSLDEAYAVLRVLRVKEELIGEYFPPNGR